jgi:hypothetical protein
MFNKTVVAVALVLLALTAGAQNARAQEAGAGKPVPAVEKIQTAYRLDFSVNEVEDGKKVNSRQYSMNLKGAGGSNEVKIGTRVPVEPKQGEFQYLDVGTNIWARLDDHNGQIDLMTRAELSNFAIPDQGEGHSSRPLIRQLKIESSTLAVLGKPMIVGSVDDPNSKRQFQLEVTVTKLR